MLPSALREDCLEPPADGCDARAGRLLAKDGRTELTRLVDDSLPLRFQHASDDEECSVGPSAPLRGPVETDAGRLSTGLRHGRNITDRSSRCVRRLDESRGLGPELRLSLAEGTAPLLCPRHTRHCLRHRLTRTQHAPLCLGLHILAPAPRVLDLRETALGLGEREALLPLTLPCCLLHELDGSKLVRDVPELGVDSRRATHSLVYGREQRGDGIDPARQFCITLLEHAHVREELSDTVVCHDPSIAYTWVG